MSNADRNRGLLQEQELLKPLLPESGGKVFRKTLFKPDAKATRAIAVQSHLTKLRPLAHFVLPSAHGVRVSVNASNIGSPDAFASVNRVSSLSTLISANRFLLFVSGGDG